MASSTPRSKPAPAPPQRTAECPRCGYDQSGVISVWGDSCSCVGRCSECGLEFAWRDVLSPAHGRIPWLYEHARGPAPRAMAASLARALPARHFWSRVRMSHTLRPARLVLLVLLVAVLSHALIVLSQGIRTILFVQEYYRFMGPTRTAPSSLREVLDFLFTHPSGIDLLRWRLLMPYGCLDEPSAATAAQSILLAPSRHLPALHLLSAVFLLLLPDTRAIAKVRPAHLLRSAAYPLALVLVIGTLGVLAGHWIETAISLLRGTILGRPVAIPEVVALPIGLAWWAWWWLLVCRTYLRLPRPILVWMLTLIVPGLAAFTLYITVNMTLFSRFGA